MIKLGLVALIVLSILGLIIFFIFSSGKPKVADQIPVSSTSPKPSVITSLSDIKDLKIKEPVQPLLANLYAPKQTKASGYVRLSEVAGKILIQLKSDSTADKTGIISSGSCAANTKIVYPLVSLKDGKSQTIWEINMEELKKQLPLSVKVYKDLKNLNSYTRCAEIE